MARYKDLDWRIPENKVETWEQARLAVLMDVRDELKKLNTLLYCQNFQNIPKKLDEIRRNTAKPKPKKARKP